MRTCVIHPDIDNRQTRRLPEHALGEVVSLAHALQLEVVHEQVVKLKKPQAGLLFGKGKLEELHGLLQAEDVGLVVIDGPVTPVQQRNLERRWKVKVLDRTGLILEIFGDRAQTREGVLQVDLAALNYAKSRLVRSWTHLERQRGGLGFVGGAGETQIESDRRAIDDAIVRIKRQLSKVVKTRALHRAARAKVPYPIVALVGYTNAGKSTLFNRLTGADVMAEDMLFATLDPTMREIELPEGQKVILSDTVGFISELPTQLVAAFRATLEEVLDADLILHVRDISHPESQAQADDVMEILTDLGISKKAEQSMIEVWNKIDLLQEPDHATTVTLADRLNLTMAVSALSGTGVDDLLAGVEAALVEPKYTQVLRLAYAEGRRRAWLFAQNVVESEEPDEIGFRVSVNWSKKQAAQFEKI